MHVVLNNDKNTCNTYLGWGATWGCAAGRLCGCAEQMSVDMGYGNVIVLNIISVINECMHQTACAT